MTSSLIANRKRKPIGLTALIDVVFILLLFFMLTSSFNQWKAVDLQTPATTLQPEQQQLTQQALLTANNTVKLGAQTWTLQQLKQLHPQQLEDVDRSAPLIVIPEVSVSIQAIVTSLESFKALGWQKISLGDVLAGTVDGEMSQ